MRFWNYESLFWTILYRWRSVFQWARVRFFCFWATMLDKETWIKDCWSIPILHMFSCLVPIHSKMWIQQQTSCLHQRLVFTRVVPVLRWVLFVRQIFVSPHSEFEQHMYSSDPRPDTVSLMQLESRRAVPQASQPPSKASARTFNSTTRWPRSKKLLQTSGSRTFFSFSCFSMADQEAVSRSAALLLLPPPCWMSQCYAQ